MDRESAPRLLRNAISTGIALLLFAVCSGRLRAADQHPSDAQVIEKDNSWTLSTSAAQRTITFADGKLLLTRFTDMRSGRELLPNGIGGETFLLLLGPDRKPVGGSSGGWQLIKAQKTNGPAGEITLNLILQRESLRVAKSYEVYPGSSIVREWLKVENAGNTPIVVADPEFLNTRLNVGELASQQFDWMTGAENNPGSWLLKTESLMPGKVRQFDSFDPFPVAGEPRYPGDGIDSRIELNDAQIWPAPAGTQKSWQYVPNATVTVPFDVKTKVAPGDRLVFRVNMHGNIGWDTTAFDPTITYLDGDAAGQSHSASKEFSSEQGKNGWRYQYLENGKFVDLVFYPGPEHNWRKQIDNPTGTPFVDAISQHPDVNQDATRVWTVPSAGTVRITGSVCNSGNRADGAGGGSGRGVKPGSSSYTPWYALYSKASKQGIFVGFDYFGHWSSMFQTDDGGDVDAHLTVAGYHATLAPGQSFTTPSGFVGLFQNDLDNAGNELLDWQYAWLWDYTRDGGNKNDNWFPALRTLGFWMKGTGWGKPGVGWTGGSPDLQSTFRKVFRVADYMRYTGVDVYHRDWGWWDIAGDWNGPDFHATGDYLRKSGMGQLIYAFLYTVDGQSKVARAHPDWVLGGTLDMSRPKSWRLSKDSSRIL